MRTEKAKKENGMVKRRKLGRGVAVVGAGLSKFGTYPKSVRTTGLFVEAFEGLKNSVDKGFGIIEKNVKRSVEKGKIIEQDKKPGICSPLWW